MTANGNNSAHTSKRYSKPDRRLKKAHAAAKTGRNNRVEAHLSRWIPGKLSVNSRQNHGDLAAFYRQMEERVFGQVIATANNPDARAIHDLRVMLRRFGEMVQAARIGRVLRKLEAKKLLAQIRAIRRIGGDVRDLDVLGDFVSPADGSGRAQPGAPEDSQAQRKRQMLAQTRRKLLVTLHRDLHKLSASRMLELFHQRLVAMPSAPDGPKPTPDHIWKRVTQNHRNFAYACRVAFADGSDELIHLARIAGKKLRYACELAVQTGITGLKKPIEQLKAFQKLTGDLHDAHIAMIFYQHYADVQPNQSATIIPRHISTTHASLHAAAMRELSHWLTSAEK